MKTKDIDAIAAIMRVQHSRAMESGYSGVEDRVDAVIGELAYYFESKNSTFNIPAFERACGCTKSWADPNNDHLEERDR